MRYYYERKKNISSLLCSQKQLTRIILSTFILRYRTNKENIIYSRNQNFDWCIIRYNIKTKEISVSKSSNWDTANEPDIEESIKVGLDNKVIFTKAKGQIYHSKELFVADDYTGFDIEKAKSRTMLWNTIPNIDKSRIGWKKYWINLLTENNIEI